MKHNRVLELREIRTPEVLRETSPEVSGCLAVRCEVVPDGRTREVLVTV